MPDYRPGSLPRPAQLFFAAVSVFAISGLYYFRTVAHSSFPQLLFQAIVYVGLPVSVLLGGVYLRYNDFSASAWWSVIGGYLGGIAFITSLLLLNALFSTELLSDLSTIGQAVVFNGNVGGLFGFIAGATRGQMKYIERLRQQLEARNETLQRRNEQLDDFAGVLAHDLRNPLTVVKGNLELMQEDSETEPVEAMEEGVERMEEIIDDTLMLARQRENVQNVTSIELADFAQTCWRRVETKDGTLTVESPGTIQGDRSRLSHVFENLYRNSIQHGGDDVTVTVGALEDGFYIEDDGPGIPAATREKIFESGFSKTQHGTGFGLSIVREIVRAHGGAITVSAGSDGGARFEITGLDTVPHRS